MARPTKINELLWLLSFYKDGLTWTQLLEKHESSFVEKGEVVRKVICFPMPTLARLLKKLIKKKHFSRISEKITRFLIMNQMDWYRLPRHAIGFWYFTFSVSFPNSACIYVWKSFDESLFEDNTNYLTKKNRKTQYLR